MLNRYKHWITGAIVGLTLPVISLYAADESVAYAPGHWSWTATVGLNPLRNSPRCPFDAHFDAAPVPLLHFERPLSAKSGHCDESVPALCHESFAGPLGGLPDSRVGIVGADDVEEFITLAGLSGLLAGADGGKTRIVI